MSDNANMPISRTDSENSGYGGHFDQGGRHGSPSGNRNNRRRRPSQQIGGDQSANHSQHPAAGGAPVQQGVHTGQQNRNPSARQDQPARQDSSVRQDPFQQRRNNNRPQRQNQPQDGGISTNSSPSSRNIPQNTSRGTEKIENTADKQVSPAKNDKNDNQSFANRKNIPVQVARNERPREPRTWGRNIRTEETHEDIHRENERLEKEIWLEIASIHTYKLD